MDQTNKSKIWSHNHKLKQEAHGPYPSPEKRFQSINTFAQSFDYAITLTKKKIIISFWRIAWFLICKSLSTLHKRMLLSQVWLKLAMYFWYFVIISPWKIQRPSFEQTWFPFTKGFFVPSLVEICPVVLEKKIFKFCQLRETN